MEQATLVEHRMLMDFLESRNAEGARNAMRIHILHAIEQFSDDVPSKQRRLDDEKKDLERDSQ